MLNQNIEEKRKIFLEKFEERYRTKKFIYVVNSGIIRKILKLIFSPKVYLPYALEKIGLIRRIRIKEIALFWGRKIYVITKDAGSTHLHDTGMLFAPPEIKLTKFLIKTLKKDDVFYDGGANFGFYTALASEFCKEVHSFEPLPDVFQCLEMSFKNDPQVFLNNVALSDKTGETEIFVASFHSEVGTILKEVANKTKEKRDKIFKIKTTTLDDYIASGKFKPTVIKLDVEGAESLVIDGGIEFFKNNNPIIAMEIWFKEERYEIYQKAIEKLRDLGYQPYFINNDGELEKVEGELESMIKQSFENFVFKKQGSNN